MVDIGERVRPPAPWYVLIGDRTHSDSNTPGSL
jgi:hypothetical protein